MKYYSINEMSKTLGVSAQTLRNWIKMENLNPIILLLVVNFKANELTKLKR